jgi:hypothetical protein
MIIIAKKKITKSFVKILLNGQSCVSDLFFFSHQYLLKIKMCNLNPIEFIKMKKINNNKKKKSMASRKLLFNFFIFILICLLDGTMNRRNLKNKKISDKLLIY